MFKVKNNLCPITFRTLFCENTNPKSSALFQRPNVNTVYKGDYSLRSFGPIVWDKMVPEEIKSILNLKDFKREITAWVPNGCPCRLCKDYVHNLGFVTLFE